jgi:hypothetical protein
VGGAVELVVVVLAVEYPLVQGEVLREKMETGVLVLLVATLELVELVMANIVVLVLMADP